jgi:hypothetical protein
MTPGAGSRRAAARGTNLKPTLFRFAEGNAIRPLVSLLNEIGFASRGLLNDVLAFGSASMLDLLASWTGAIKAFDFCHEPLNRFGFNQRPDA